MRQESSKNTISFVSATYFWAQSLPCAVVNISWENPGKRTNFFCQYIASWSGVGAHTHFSLSVLGLHLYRPNPCCHNLCEFIDASCLLCMKTLFPCHNKSHLALTTFPLPPPHIPCTLEGFDKDIPLENKCSKIFQSLTLSSCVSKLVPTYCKEQLLCWWLNDTDLWVESCH